MVMSRIIPHQFVPAKRCKLPRVAATPLKPSLRRAATSNVYPMDTPVWALSLVKPIAISVSGPTALVLLFLLPYLSLPITREVLL